MTTICEGNLEHRFPADWTASKYDEWPYYRNHFERGFGGCKAVDFVAQDPQDRLWLVELKDYRVYPRTKPSEIAAEVAVKVRDSLAGIFAAAKWHSDHLRAQDARRHLGAKKIRVVLHLEQPQRDSKMFPQVGELSKIQQQLKQLVKSVDPHPLVINLRSPQGLPWSMDSIPGEAL